MRIIGGKFKGFRLNPPKNLPVRPTSDMAKEALFNILTNRLEFDTLKCLDLFAGTGNVSFELASRGVKEITSYDIHNGCVRFIKETGRKFNITNLTVGKVDIMRFLKSPKGKESFDFIFADPPYDMPGLSKLPQMIFDGQLLNPQGLLVLEHPSLLKIDPYPALEEVRKYGGTSFSFYVNNIQ